MYMYNVTRNDREYIQSVHIFLILVHPLTCVKPFCSWIVTKSSHFSVLILILYACYFFQCFCLLKEPVLYNKETQTQSAEPEEPLGRFCHGLIQLTSQLGLTDGSVNMGFTMA